MSIAAEALLAASTFDNETRVFQVAESLNYDLMSFEPPYFKDYPVTISATVQGVLSVSGTFTLRVHNPCTDTSKVKI